MKGWFGWQTTSAGDLSGHLRDAGEQRGDTATGALLRTRTLKSGTARGVNDLLAVFTYTSGNVTREESYGGNVQALGTGELCGLALPANQYRIDHGWQYGVRSYSQYVNAAGAALSFKNLDSDVDLNTGL